MFAGFMEGFGLKKKGIAIGMLLLFTCLLLAGCGAASTEKKAVAGSDGIKIVTSFYPMYVATINITKGVEGVEVTNMTKPQTGCLHDYQLTTEDMKKLEKANVFVVNGGGMEAFLDKVIKQQKNLQIVDASKDIELLQGDEGPNPHVWVRVSNAIQQVKNITSQLCAIDPTHADAYRANALDYVQRLSNLKNEMHQQLDALPHHDIVTFHEAFPYFAQEFNLNIVSVVEREPGTEPSPKELEATVAQVKALPVKVLFTEPQYPKGAAQTIARETGARIYQLDPCVTGEATPAAADAYIHAMQENAKVLREALQ